MIYRYSRSMTLDIASYYIYLWYRLFFTSSNAQSLEN
jgi:hypothetical protein